MKKQKKLHGWSLTKDKLPNIGQLVVGYSRSISKYRLCSWDGSRWVENNQPIQEPVTSWLHIRKPPDYDYFWYQNPKNAVPEDTLPPLTGPRFSAEDLTDAESDELPFEPGFFGAAIHFNKS